MLVRKVGNSKSKRGAFTVIVRCRSGLVYLCGIKTRATVGVPACVQALAVWATVSSMSCRILPLMKGKYEEKSDGTLSSVSQLIPSTRSAGRLGLNTSVSCMPHIGMPEHWTRCILDGGWSNIRSCRNVPPQGQIRGTVSKVGKGLSGHLGGHRGR